MNLGSTRVRHCMRRTWFFVQAKQENWNAWWCLLGCTLLLRYHTNCSPRTPCLEWMSGNKMSWTHVLALEWVVVGGLFIVVFNMSEQALQRPSCLWRVAVAPWMASWLPGCWYDHSIGNLVWVKATFSVAGVERKGCSSMREGTELLQVNFPG